MPLKLRNIEITRRIVLAANCPSGELSARRVVRGELSAANCPRGELSNHRIKGIKYTPHGY